MSPKIKRYSNFCDTVVAEHGDLVDWHDVKPLLDELEHLRPVAARWDKLKEWLATATTNSALADDSVSAMRDVVFLIEEEDRPPEPAHDPQLTGQALLDDAREKRLAAVARREAMDPLAPLVLSQEGAKRVEDLVDNPPEPACALHQPLAGYSDRVEQYKAGVALLRAAREAGDEEECDNVSDKLDVLWYAMSPAEFAAVARWNKEEASSGQ